MTHLLTLLLLAQVTLQPDQQVPITLTADGDRIYKSPVFTVDLPSVLEVVTVDGKTYARAKGVGGTAVVTVNATNRVGKLLTDTETYIVAAPPATSITIVSGTPEPIPAPPVVVPTAGLIQSGDLIYVGAFRFPGGAQGESSFEYGGAALSFNPANNSLFVGGHDWQPSAVAEINIPALGTGAYSTLPVATVRQPFVETKLRVPNLTLDGNVKIGGTLLVNGDLLGTLYEYYDGSGDAVDSHFRIAGADLKGAYTGLFQVGTKGGGWVGGWMCEVPAAWQGPLGTKYLTGQGALSIISRTSYGPAAFGFDPAMLGATPAPVVPLLFYDSTHPLAPFDRQGELFNASTNLTGIAFPEGSDSVLFFGRQGTGALKYGTGTTDQSLDGQPVPNEPGNFYIFDPADTSKGYHAYPYRYQVWAYDAHDLAAVKAGTKQPWEVRPYKTWELTLPYASNFRLGGVAWDAAGRKLYVGQKHVSGGMPVVHGFGIK